MKSIVGHCPKCGAPIYVSSPWFGILPPPNEFTCSCVKSKQTVITTTNTN